MGNQYYLALGTSAPADRLRQLRISRRPPVRQRLAIQSHGGPVQLGLALELVPGLRPRPVLCLGPSADPDPERARSHRRAPYTIAGFEGVPAVSRPLLSVPYMFNYGQPFTHFGMLSRLHLSDRITLFNGTINGWDRWIDRHYVWGYIGGLSWTRKTAGTTSCLPGSGGRTSSRGSWVTTTTCTPPATSISRRLAGLPNPGYKRNDRTLLTWVFSRKWTEKLVQTIETDQGWERSIPGLASGGS